MNRRRKPKFQHSDHHQSQPSLTPSDYSFSLTKIAVSQICKSVGYKSANSSAINTLTLITTKFLQSLAGLAASLSNTANRTEVNLFDIINSLQDISLSTSDCFPGDSTTSHCLISSNILRGLSDFVANYPEIPFAKPLPKPEVNGSSFTLPSEVVNNKSVPFWLPAFPDSSLYVESCVKETSDKLWENSDSVIGDEVLTSESLKFERSGGSLPKRRGKVRFKVERNRKKDENDGVLDCEIESIKKKKKKIRGGFIFSDGDWSI